WSRSVDGGGATAGGMPLPVGTARILASATERVCWPNWLLTTTVRVMIACGLIVNMVRWWFTLTIGVTAPLIIFWTGLQKRMILSWLMLSTIGMAASNWSCNLTAVASTGACGTR